MRHILLAAALLASAAASFAQVESPKPSPGAALARPNSVTVFGGRLSTTDFVSTLIFNLNYTPDTTFGKRAYDNYIAGVDYERDFLELWPGVRLGAEVGADDRFGHYLVCCEVPLPYYKRKFPDRTVWTSSLVHSAELRAGAKLRWGSLEFWGARFEVAATVGLSGVTRSIGRERQREIDYHANAHLLGYVAPELGVSLDRLPQLELLLRIMHRSGAGGTFGGMKEGYNANVIGLRYSF